MLIIWFNSKIKIIDLGEKEYENKIFFVKYAFLSKSFPDIFIIIVSNFYNKYSLNNKEPNGEVYYYGFTFDFSNYFISNINSFDQGLIFHEKKANSLMDIKNNFLVIKIFFWMKMKIVGTMEIVIY